MYRSDMTRSCNPEGARFNYLTLSSLTTMQKQHGISDIYIIYLVLLSNIIYVIYQLFDIFFGCSSAL